MRVKIISVRNYQTNLFSCKSSKSIRTLFLFQQHVARSTTLDYCIQCQSQSNALIMSMSRSYSKLTLHYHINVSSTRKLYKSLAQIILFHTADYFLEFCRNLHAQYIKHEVMLEWSIDQTIPELKGMPTLYISLATYTLYTVFTQPYRALRDNVKHSRSTKMSGSTQDL